MPPDVTGTLEQIHEAAAYIAADTAGLSFDAFMADRRTRQVVERNFVNIGESINRLQRHAPGVVEQIGDREQMVALRNALMYEYDRVDHPAVWFAVQESLPVLRAEVESLLSEVEAK